MYAASSAGSRLGRGQLVRRPGDGVQCFAETFSPRSERATRSQCAICYWSKGGPTALHNLVLLCPQHHRVIHHDGWTVHLGPDRLPVFTPPRWVDPDQIPRPAWRPLTLLRT
jgi:hypothetical protein